MQASSVARERGISVPLLLASVVQGLFSLFPYNSFLSSSAYFEHYFQYAAVRYTDDVNTLPTTKNTVFWNNASTWGTVGMLISMFVAQIVCVCPVMLNRNVRLRLLGGSSLLFLSMLLMPVCASNGGVSESSAIAIVILCSVLTGSGTSIFQASLYGMMSTAPTIYVSGCALGGGLSGTFNSLLRIIIYYGLPSTFVGIKNGAVIFYCVGMSMMVMAAILVFLLPYSEVLRSSCAAFLPGLPFYADPPRDPHSTSQRNENPVERVDGDSDSPQLISVDVDLELLKPGSQSAFSTEPIGNVEPDVVDERDTPNIPGMNRGSDDRHFNSTQERVSPPVDGRVAVTVSSEGEATSLMSEDDRALSVAKRIWPMMFLGFSAFFISLVFFPRIGVKAMQESNPHSTSTTESSNDGWEREKVMPLVVILCYNIGDSTGRMLPLIRALWLPKKVLFLISGLRVIVAVVLLTLGLVRQKIINSNADPMCVYAFLGITNGYLMCSSIAYGCSDKKLNTEREHATAGTCMSFAMLIGCCVGSIVSLIVLLLAF